MTEPFNVEKFRQQMRGEAPVAPQAAPAQMQVAPAAIPQAVPQSVPQPYSAPQMQQVPQMVSQPVPQPMAPPMPQNPGFQTPQPPTQAYSPPVGGQPQAWVPQGQAQVMQGQAMHAPQMIQPPVYAAPSATMAAPELDAAAPKKQRFNLKRLIKEKGPKIKKAAKAQTAAAEAVSTDVHTTKTSPAMIFMFGMATGIACFLVGNMIMSNVFASKASPSIKDIAKNNASIGQPVLPPKKADVATELNAKSEK